MDGGLHAVCQSWRCLTCANNALRFVGLEEHFWQCFDRK